MIEEIYLFGIGPLAETVYYIAEEIKTIEIKGFVIDDEYYDNELFLNKPVLKLSHVDKNIKMISCIGYKNMRNRKKIYIRLKSIGIKFTNIIHPSVIMSKDISLGENNIILPQVCIEPKVIIGNNNVIWSQTLIGHNSIIENHNYLSAKVLFSGNTKMNELCFIGNGVSMIDNLLIMNESYVVAGSMLYRNTKPFSKYFGNPAKKIGNHEDEGVKITR